MNHRAIELPAASDNPRDVPRRQPIHIARTYQAEPVHRILMPPRLAHAPIGVSDNVSPSLAPIFVGTADNRRTTDHQDEGKTQPVL